MDTALKIIGERLRKVFGDPTKSAMGWSLIDAFTRLEEREEALRQDDDDDSPSLQAGIVGSVNKDN
jgi:hypothetical protein